MGKYAKNGIWSFKIIKMIWWDQEILMKDYQKNEFYLYYRSIMIGDLFDSVMFYRNH